MKNIDVEKTIDEICFEDEAVEKKPNIFARTMDWCTENVDKLATAACVVGGVIYTVYCFVVLGESIKVMRLDRQIKERELMK